MGKWAELYIEEKSTPLTETTANSCQKPKKAGGDPLLSVIGSGFVPAPEKNTFSEDRAKISKVLQETTDKTAKTPISNFCQLVRHYGADHQFLLSYEEIMAGLDANDIASLMRLDRHEKQVWAELLAHRLTRDRTRPMRSAE